MATRCPKCGSSMIYADEDIMSGESSLACKMCGKRWRPGFKPYTKLEEEMSIKGKCVNCGREGLTLPSRGMCGGCYTRIKDMTWDSPECKAALARAKKDFNDPDYKQTHRRKTKKLSPVRFEKIGKHIDDDFQKAIDFSNVITAIDMQITHHRDIINKLTEARQILAA